MSPALSACTDPRFLFPVLAVLLTSVFNYTLVVTWSHTLAGTNGQPGFFFRKAVIHHFMGGIIMGGLPILLWIFLMPYGGTGWLLNPPTISTTLWCTAGILAVLVPVSVFIARKADAYGKYPEIRLERWTRGMLLIHLAAWAFYLVGYEILFRGLLLFPIAETLGTWPAIFLNTFLYILFHIPKGKNEMIVALPLGVGLCYLSIYTGDIWAATLIHIGMAWTGVLVGVSRFKASSPDSRS